MKGVRGQFDIASKKTWPCALDTDDKGDMNDYEFEKYVITKLTCLYPYLADTAGLRYILNVDSGPGRMNIKLLAKLRGSRLVFLPWSAITQETDQSFGEFKCKFCANLNTLDVRD